MNDIEDRIRAAFEPYRFQADREPLPSALAPPKGPIVRRPRFLLVAAAIIVTTALIVALSAIRPGDRMGGADPAAAATLHDAAAAAGDGPWFGSLHDGQYLYFKMVQANPHLCPKQGDLSVEWWLDADGAGRGVATPGRTSALTPTTSLYNYWSYENYPTDPEVLSARFASDPNFGGGVPDFMGTGNAATFDKISGLVGEFTAPPELRAALFDVVAGLDGVELIGSVTDPVGRTGTAVGYTYEGVRRELIFDPVTAQLLATQWVLVDPQVASAAGRTEAGCSGSFFPTGPAGTVEDSTSFYPPAVVNSITERP